MSKGVKKILSGTKMGRWHYCAKHKHYWCDFSVEGTGTDKDTENKDCDATDEDNAEEETDGG